MATLVREAKDTRSFRPLALLLAIAFIYGVIHAAGPGHGKAIAVSYILSQQPKLKTGILFGNLIALFHGLSGILFVLLLRIILQKSVTGTMGDMTRVTQIISFGLIACIGIGILVKSIFSWIKGSKFSEIYSPKGVTSNHKGMLLSALAVGMVPCAGVVMVMLFSLSMNFVILGIILGIAISFGMALSITVVVIVGQVFKSAMLSVSAGQNKWKLRFECLIEGTAGFMLATLGILFLLATI
ncbi:MAG: hypothetical protein JRF71_10455 [Deltaproteobacteria bacterium]|nr:hypothetical protein [Deltaproteobacteria bacterium]